MWTCNHRNICIIVSFENAEKRRLYHRNKSRDSENEDQQGWYDFYGAGRGNHIALDAYIDTSKYETEEDIIEVLKTMDIKIVYTLMDDSSDSVDDWSKVTTAYMPVGF